MLASCRQTVLSMYLVDFKYMVCHNNISLYWQLFYLFTHTLIVGSKLIHIHIYMYIYDVFHVLNFVFAETTPYARVVIGVAKASWWGGARLWTIANQRHVICGRCSEVLIGGWGCLGHVFNAVIGEDLHLVRNEPVEFEKLTSWSSRLQENYRSS